MSIRLTQALEEKLLDTRLRDKLVAEKKLSASQVKDYLGKLADEEGNFEFTENKDKESATE